MSVLMIEYFPAFVYPKWARNRFWICCTSCKENEKNPHKLCGPQIIWIMFPGFYVTKRLIFRNPLCYTSGNRKSSRRKSETGRTVPYGRMWTCISGISAARGCDQGRVLAPVMDYCITRIWSFLYQILSNQAQEAGGENGTPGDAAHRRHPRPFSRYM